MPLNLKNINKNDLHRHEESGSFVPLFQKDFHSFLHKNTFSISCQLRQCLFQTMAVVSYYGVKLHFTKIFHFFKLFSHYHFSSWSQNIHLKLRASK